MLFISKHINQCVTQKHIQKKTHNLSKITIIYLIFRIFIDVFRCEIYQLIKLLKRRETFVILNKSYIFKTHWNLAFVIICILYMIMYYI